MRSVPLLPLLLLRGGRYDARRPGEVRPGIALPGGAIIAWSLLAWAGFFATLVVSWLAAFAYWRGITRLPLATTLGGLLLRGRSAPRLRALVGGLAHVVLGTLAFPAVYALIFELAGRTDVRLGALLGAGHALLAGLALPAAWRGARQEGRAGIFGWRLGRVTPPGLIAAHVLYGVLLAYIYVAP